MNRLVIDFLKENDFDFVEDCDLTMERVDEETVIEVTQCGEMFILRLEVSERYGRNSINRFVLRSASDLVQLVMDILE